MGRHRDREEDDEKKRIVVEEMRNKKKKIKIKKIEEKYHPPKDCATSGYERRIHNESVWKFLQDTYYNQTVLASSTSATLDKNRNKNNKKKKQQQQQRKPVSGFTVDVIIKDDDGGPHGRSVYAAQPIKKGTKVYKPYHLIKFESQKQLFMFLQELDDHDLQCDCLLWAYVEKNHNYVSLALDGGSFINHGNTRKERNLNSHSYSTRDINVGEELLEDYSEFIGFNQLQWFDKIRGDAWKSHEVKEQIGRSQKSMIAKSIRQYNLFGSTPKSLTEQHHHSNNNNKNKNNNNHQHHHHHQHANLDVVVGATTSSYLYTTILLLLAVIALVFMRRNLFPLYRHRFVNNNKKQKDGI